MYSSPWHPHFGEASFRGFSRIFRKLEVKATNCRAFRSSILRELDGVTVTQRVEPTAAAKLPSPVTMGLSCGHEKRSEKSGKRRRRVACVFHSIWYFFHNAYAVDLFVAVVTCTCRRRPRHSMHHGDVQSPSDVRPLRVAHPLSFFERENLPSHLSRFKTGSYSPTDAFKAMSRNNRNTTFRCCI